MPLLFKQVHVVDNSATGAKARESRVKVGRSLRSVAEAMGVSAAFLSDLELGRRNWTKENLKQFTAALK